jgi:hypothetical protein
MRLIISGMTAITGQLTAQLLQQREIVVVPQWLPRPLNVMSSA